MVVLGNKKNDGSLAIVTGENDADGGCFAWQRRATVARLRGTTGSDSGCVVGAEEKRRRLLRCLLRSSDEDGDSRDNGELRKL